MDHLDYLENLFKEMRKIKEYCHEQSQMLDSDKNSQFNDHTEAIVRLDYIYNWLNKWIKD